MAGIINTSSIQSLLRPGLAAVFGDYESYKAQWADIFSKHTSKKNYELETEMRLLGPAQLKAEGAAGQYGNMGQMFGYQYIHQTFFTGFIITEEAVDDNLYEDSFPKQALALKNSLAETKNIQGASILNNGFSSSYTGGDGVSLFNTAHPIQGGTVSNTFSVPTQLNETALTNAITAIANFRGASGLRTVNEPKKLIVPQQLWQTAKILLGSKFRTSTANNDINPVYDDVLPEGYRVNNFLSSPTAWFIITDNSNGLKYYDRKAMTVDSITDQDTNSLKVRAFERYSFGWSDFRGAFGSQGV